MPTFFEKLSRMAAAESEPKIDAAELTEILAGFAKTDAEGRTPDEPEWEPTYNLRAAAREAWKRKMGRASELQSTDLDGDRMSANQIFEHCERMVRQYAGAATAISTLEEAE